MNEFLVGNKDSRDGMLFKFISALKLRFSEVLSEEVGEDCKAAFKSVLLIAFEPPGLSNTIPLRLPLS